ncbi:MAG: 4-(cytidine 5'-diphospho)-2-C-methyl-D-erythritol kinase, partial [Clostridia bacterium]|nr:4-(cytidine 5'-diphospho)-2-C-methyl-D-erythritol kinase [Clostridia bacterium]
MEITVMAPAKINIFLDILRRLDNGYHSLFMLMQTVGLYDTVTLSKSASGIELTCSEPGIPADERNTACKAAKLFFEKTGIDAGVKIDIKKNI